MMFNKMSRSEVTAFAENLKTNPPKTEEELSNVLDFALFLVDQLNHQFDVIFDEVMTRLLADKYGDKWSDRIFDSVEEMWNSCASNLHWEFTDNINMPEKGCTLYEMRNKTTNQLTLVAVKEPT